MGIEQLVKLGPGSINLEGAGGGGRPELTTAELGCYLVGATDMEWFLAMTMYVGEDYTGKLARYLYEISQKWKKPKRNKDEVKMPIFNKMGLLAVSEFMDSGICPLCRGEKVVHAKECPACGGTGTIRKTDSDKARQCHLKPERWKAYEPVFNMMMMRLSAMDSANKNKIYYALNEDQKVVEL